jgi:hypothetical protein
MDVADALLGMVLSIYLFAGASSSDFNLEVMDSHQDYTPVA